MATTESAGVETRTRDVVRGGKDTAEIGAQEKKEVRAGAEHTHPGRYYVPPADIYETDEAVIVVMDLPGVARGQVDVQLERDVLSVEARIDPAKYRDLTPVYTEYNVGNYARRFVLGESVERDQVSARLENGVLILELPKAHQARPRRIQVD